MRYIEIDGQKIEVHGCEDCPCCDEGEGGYGECGMTCKHPSVSKLWQVFTATIYRSGVSVGEVVCPLREVEE